MSNKSAADEAKTRHLAFQIAAQLPEDTSQALRVLDYTRKLVLHTVEDGVAPISIVKSDR